MGGETSNDMNMNAPMDGAMNSPTTPTPAPDMDADMDTNTLSQDSNFEGGNEKGDEIPNNGGNEGFDMGGNGEEGDSNEIKSLSGKLADKLRNTNNSNDKKFAAGMINAAAVEGLSPEDKSDIIKKINKSEGTKTMSEQFIFTKKQINEIRKGKLK